MALSYPSNVATVTVTGYWAASDGSGPASGTVTFTPNSVLQDGTSVPPTIVLPKAQTATLINGAISVQLMATDDAHLAPLGWVYSVVENISNQSRTRPYDIQLPASQPTVDLATVAKVVTPPALVSYIAASTATTKGDLLVATGPAAITRQGVGSDGQVLTADSAQPAGVRWGTGGGGGVTSWASKTGAVTPAKSDIPGLVADLAAKTRYRGAWAPSTAYVTNDLLTYAGNTFVVTADFTSGTVFALTNLSALDQPAHIFNVAHYGADPTFTNDSTAAIRATIDAAEAYAIASPFGYAMVDGVGVFKIAGPLITTKSGNAQIPLPVRAVASNKLTIVIGRLPDAASVPHWQQTTPQLSGFVLRSTLNSPDFSGTSNEGSVLGGPTPANGYGRAALYSNVNVVIRGVQVMVPMTARGADTWGIDLRGMANCHLNGVAAYTDATPPTIIRGSASGWACGIALPTPGNNDLSIADNISIEGFTYGLYAGEHVESNRAALVYCYIGVLAGAFWSSVGQQHSNHFASLSVEASSVGVQVMNSGKIVIDAMSTEGTMNHVVDATGNATGSINLSGIISAINFSDPTGIKVIYVDAKPGAYTAPAMPASGAAFRNPAWRDAQICLSGGTGVSIAIDGVTQPGITAGMVYLPSGKKITVTYTIQPTWTWTLL